MKIKNKLIFQTETTLENIPELESFIKSINDKISFCDKCNKFIRRKTERKHYDEVHLCKRISCPICGIKIKRRTPHLNIHLKDNNKTHIFEYFSFSNCPNDICNSKSNNNKLLYNNNNMYDKIITNYKKDMIKYNNEIYAFKSFNIGEGIHSQFIFGINKKTKNPIGIKIYKDSKSNHFKKEIDMMNKLEKYNIFPKVINFEENKKENYIAESLLGIDLIRLFEFEKNSFDSITILNIAIDILQCLLFIHKENISHCDIKADNLIWNIFSEKNEKTKIVLIDFSCAINLSDKTLCKKVGSNFYSSLNQNLKNIPNENDEIESLFYTLLYLFDIDLPWIADEINDKEDKKKVYIYQKEKFKIEDYLNSDLKVLELIFNDSKRKDKLLEEDFIFYGELLNDQIEKLKKKYDVNYRFIWQAHIENILIKAKESKERENIENKLFNELFFGYPKEFILYILNNNLNNI